MSKKNKRKYNLKVQSNLLESEKNNEILETTNNEVSEKTEEVAEQIVNSIRDKENQDRILEEAEKANQIEEEIEKVSQTEEEPIFSDNENESSIKNLEVHSSEFGNEDDKDKRLVKKSIVGVALLLVGTIAVALGAKGCSTSNDKNNSVDDNTTSVSGDSSLLEDISANSTELESEIENSINSNLSSQSKDELEHFSSIDYITKDELVELYKTAEENLKGTQVTTEELVAFVTEINKTVINSELNEVLVTSGAIHEDENLNRQNYLNAIDKIRNSMINAKTIEIDPELVGIPEYDALIEELKNNAIDINISNFVSENSDEYETYVLLDKAYEEIGDSTTSYEAINAFEPVLELVNSENGENMPNNMEEEIYKDLYKDAYDEITASKYGFLVTELNGVFDNEMDPVCPKTLTR